MQIPIVKGKQLNMLVHMVDTKDKVEKQTQPLQLSPTGGKKGVQKLFSFHQKFGIFSKIKG